MMRDTCPPRFLVLMALVSIVVLAGGAAPTPEQRKARLAEYMAMLERPERESFQKPDQVMAALALRPGERVADIGAGTGYFTLRVARAVGPQGVVWALDLVPEFLEHVAARAKDAGLANVRTKKVLPTDPQLEPGSVDTILMVDTIHYVKDRAAYAKALRAALAPGGRLVVIDYIPRSEAERPWGPPVEQQMSKETLDAELKAGGFVPVKVHTFLPEQYFVEYRAE